MQEKHKVVKKYKTKKKKKNRQIITEKKRANEQRDRVTRCESPSPRTIKPITTKRSKQLIFRTIHILKRTTIMFPQYALQRHNGTKFQMFMSVSQANSSKQNKDQTPFLKFLTYINVVPKEEFGNYL